MDVGCSGLADMKQQLRLAVELVVLVHGSKLLGLNIAMPKTVKKIERNNKTDQ